MKPGSSDRDGREDDGPGLLGGITAYHLRLLVDNPWDGGAGYNPEQVARLTLDQIMFRLCDKELLKNPVGKRTKKAKSDVVLGLVGSDQKGQVKARTKDGKVIKLKSTGKSKVQMIRERKEKEKRQG